MRKTISIQSIADELKMKPEDVLLRLAKHNIILATVTEGLRVVEAIHGFETSDFNNENVPISEEIVLRIATDGIWRGKRIRVLHKITQITGWKNLQIDSGVGVEYDYGLGYEIEGYISKHYYEPTFTDVLFKEETSLTSNQLFVYEDDFSRIEPTLTEQPPTGAETATTPTKAETTTTPTKAETATPPTPFKAKKKYKPRCAISAAAAAAFLGISTRQVQNWDKGINMPADYPGRADETSFLMFVNRWNHKKQLTAQAKAMNKAVSDSEAVARATKNAFDD